MQFHLNGFRTGDPSVFEPSEPAARRNPGDNLPSEADVVIVGCGPAGLTLATQLSAFPEIKTVIVDQKNGPLKVGQADGIACRSMEMFQAFGFCERVVREAYWVNETVFWKPDAANPREIARSGRIQDVEDGLSEFPHVILNQARVHDFYLETMRNAPTRLEPYYSRRLMEVSVGKGDDYPVLLRFEPMGGGHSGGSEVVRANYVVGCDGARSTVRKFLGLDLHGDSANQAWGVMDVLAVTDFPDIRFKTVIHSANEGNMLIIPREGGYMVRLYIELEKLSENERLDSQNASTEKLVAAANRILHPYRLDVQEIAWWSVYEIGQRLCDRFDNAETGNASSIHPRAFITGDACHTHSPKAGQGMNVSMGDSFNLGWKLASVLKGRCLPELLHTYSTERQAIARELIDFDREFAKMFSAPPKTSDSDTSESVDPAEFQRYFTQHGRFTAGTAFRYQPSVISGVGKHQHMAKGFIVGMRFHSAPVTRLADAKPVQLGHTVAADGRWRLFAFADRVDPAGPSSAMHGLCDFLANSPESPVRKFTDKSADNDSVIDVRAIFQQGHRDLEMASLPPFLLPAKGKYGLRDYEKMFCPDISGKQNIFDMRGIDRQRGCIVLVRPDQHVADILPLDAFSELSDFFSAFMIPAR